LKAEFKINTQDFIDEIVREVVKRLKPHLNKINEDDTVYTVKTLAKYLQVSEKWVYERIQRNEIPFIKIGKFPRFKKSDIDHWLNSLKTPCISVPSNQMHLVRKD